jgi:hypothetical protein
MASIQQKIESGKVKVTGALKVGAVQEEGAAHQADDAKTDADLHKAAEKIGEKIHNQAEVSDFEKAGAKVGKKLDEATAKRKVTKAKKRETVTKAGKPTYPAETSINAYAFLRVPAQVMQALGVKSHKKTNKAGKEVDVYAITTATITGYDAQTKILTIQLKAA